MLERGSHRGVRQTEAPSSSATRGETPSQLAEYGTVSEQDLTSPPNTPRQREFELSDISENVKTRVDLATSTLTGSRCLLENADNIDGVDYVHVLKRSTPSYILNNLELAWNMPPATLNVNTRQNILRLSPQFHALFDDEYHWMLVPEENILKQYLDTCTKPPSQFPVINEAPYKYTIFAHDNMKDVAIRRYAPAPGSSQDLTTTPAFMDHTHPFTEFGTLISHIHPRFVIANCGPKVRRQISSFRATSTVSSELKFMLLNIYTNWTTRDRRSFDPDTDSDGYDTDQSDSIDMQQARLRPAFEQANSPCDAPSNSYSHEAHADKMASIRTWAAEVRPNDED